MPYTIPRVVISGLKGGSGKTALSLGLLSAFRQAGQKIAPFKKGPDYIDAGWLARASGRPCHNLDAFLFPEESIIKSLVSNSSDAEGALIEGNRGIFDGMDERGTFSTARLATSIASPVVLIVDCTKATTTISAIVKGIIDFHTDLTIGGIVLNQIAGNRHESVIRRSLETYTDAKVVGVLRRLKQDLLGERHLGLIPYHESREVDVVLSTLGSFVKDSVNVNEVLDIMNSAPPIEASFETARRVISSTKLATIGVLRDSAFQFYYPENITMLEDKGADIVEINALQGRKLPDVDALYIGGGFPETHGVQLSRNRALLDDIKNKAEKGLPIYAECGGLMYLGEMIEYGGETYPMAGVLPVSFEMKKSPVAHGYTKVEVEQENPYFEVGQVLRGHEFHYSRVHVLQKEGAKFVFVMKRGKGITDGHDGINYKNVLATYTHLHALGCPQWVDSMINVARLNRRHK